MLGLELGIPYDGQLKMEFVDMAGKIVMTDRSAPFEAGEHSMECNVERLPAEVYLLRVYTGKEMIMKKIFLLK